jgi:hypothetical protein
VSTVGRVVFLIARWAQQVLFCTAKSKRVSLQRVLWMRELFSLRRAKIRGVI